MLFIHFFLQATKIGYVLLRLKTRAKIKMYKSIKDDYVKLFFALSIILLIFDTVILIRTNHLENELNNINEILQPPKSLDVGEDAPDFSSEDYQNNIVELKNYNGKGLLLVFSSPTCTACQVFWPTLKEFTTLHTKIDVVMISSGTKEDVIKMQEQQNFLFPIIINEELFNDYKVPGTPYLYLISPYLKVDLSGFSNSLDEIGKRVDK